MVSFQSLEKLKERTARNMKETNQCIVSTGLEPVPPDYEPSELPNTQPQKQKKLIFDNATLSKISFFKI